MRMFTILSDESGIEKIRKEFGLKESGRCYTVIRKAGEEDLDA